MYNRNRIDPIPKNGRSERHMPVSVKPPERIHGEETDDSGMRASDAAKGDWSLYVLAGLTLLILGTWLYNVLF